MTDRRERILVVDDERFNLNVLVDLLKGDYDVMVAKNGAQALKRVEAATPPDLILLDIMMPEMDGFEVCRRIKDDPRTHDIPVIFVSALNQVGDEEKGLELGAVDYISKPISPPLVRLRVRNHLKLKRQSDLLRQLVTMDGLTGIPNRRRFDEYLDQEWKRALRHGTSLALILMDIDFFKRYNDNYGHAAGDDCLRRVAQALADTAERSTDLVARYGGEEFVCLLPDVDPDGLAILGEKMRRTVFELAIPHEHSDAADRVTVSLGGTCLVPSPAETQGRLAEQADRNLYAAKGQGRNRFVG